MVMTFLPGSIAQTPMRDDLRRFVLASPLDTYIANMAALDGYFPFDDGTGNTYSRVVNPAIAEGRNLVQNPTPSSATGWTLNANWAYGSSLFTHTTGSTATLTQALAGAVVIGKLYKIIYTVSGRTAGTITPSLGVSLSAQSTNATFTQVVIATGTTLTFTPSSTFDGSISVFSVTQVGILASSVFPTTELVINPGFDWDVAYTKGAGWTIAAGVAHAAAAAVGVQLTQALSMLIGRSYDIIYTISNYVGGSIRVKAGSGAAGTTRSANGTFTETLTCTTTTTLAFDPITGAFTGDIDNVSVVPHDGLIAWDGGFESWTNATTPADWTKTLAGTSSINQETGSVHSGSNACRFDVDGSNSVAQIKQTCLKTGALYQVSFWAKASSASANLIAADDGMTDSFTLTTSYAQYTSLPFVTNSATFDLKRGTSAASKSIYIDDIVITELDPMTGTPINGISLNQTSGNALLDPVYNADGINDGGNLFSATLNSVFNPAGDFTIVLFVKPSSSAIWTDGLQHQLLYASADATNDNINIAKLTTNNRLQIRFVAAGTVKNVIVDGLAYTDWFMVELKVQQSTNTMTGWINGVLVGTTTSIGVWAGNFVSTTFLAGTTSTAGANPWSGFMSSYAFINAVTEPDVSLLLAELGGVA